MKKWFLGVVLAVALALVLSPGSAKALKIDYANVDNAAIAFSGATDSFTFIDSTIGANAGKDFSITGGTGLLDSANTIGLLGHIGGTFTIGAITTFGGLQTAPVTGTGVFQITDKSANLFSATVAWVDIFTLGGSGGINSGLAANLTNITYTGSDLDLLALLNGATTNITFQFNPAKSLTALTTEASNTTSYSGSISPVPEPAAMLLLGGGLIAIWGFRKRMKK